MNPISDLTCPCCDCTAFTVVEEAGVFQNYCTKCSCPYPTEALAEPEPKYDEKLDRELSPELAPSYLSLQFLDDGSPVDGAPDQELEPDPNPKH